MALGRAKFPFVPRHDDEVKVNFNDIVTIIEKDSGVDGWMEVELRGNRGKLPADYIETLVSPYLGATGTAIFDFSHPTDSETGQFLNFSAGDEVTVIDRPTSGWCVGVFDSHIGLFPEGYVALSPSTFEDVEKVKSDTLYSFLQFIQTSFNWADV
jgi:hypothetical protein